MNLINEASQNIADRLTWHTANTVSDGMLEDTCEATVTVVDVDPPVINSFTVSPIVLWPPNHKMVTITPGLNAEDNCDIDTVTYVVTSNEPVNGVADGNTTPDWIVNGANIQLRAERSGQGSGRVYTITVTVKDTSGNTSTASTTAQVPLNQG
jgi:hypothetical protein